jgi:hypothetical protein
MAELPPDGSQNWRKIWGMSRSKLRAFTSGEHGPCWGVGQRERAYNSLVKDTLTPAGIQGVWILFVGKGKDDRERSWVRLMS